MTIFFCKCEMNVISNASLICTHFYGKNFSKHLTTVYISFLASCLTFYYSNGLSIKLVFSLLYMKYYYEYNAYILNITLYQTLIIRDMFWWIYIDVFRICKILCIETQTLKMLEAYCFVKQNLACPNKFIRRHRVYILLSYV